MKDMVIMFERTTRIYGFACPEDALFGIKDGKIVEYTGTCFLPSSEKSMMEEMRTAKLIKIYDVSPDKADVETIYGMGEQYRIIGTSASITFSRN